MCVCVCERERETETEKKKETDRRSPSKAILLTLIKELAVIPHIRW
jgi:hypothetical protein